MKSWIKANSLALFGSIVYFASYMTRKNYSAALVAIIKDLATTEEIASIAVTGCFITYGLGQIISGILGDKFNPRYVVLLGLFATSGVNLCMSLMPNITGLTILWILNGFFQSLLWPPLVKILADNLDTAGYNRAILIVSVGSTIATVLIYLVVPLAIAVSGWRLAFTISGVIGMAAAGIWLLGTKNVKSEKGKKKISEETTAPTKAVPLKTALTASGFLLIIMGIILQGTLRDGIETWMPTYIDQNFNLGSALSILTSIVLPVFSFIAIKISDALEYKLGGVIKLSIILFAISFVCAIALALLHSKALIAEILLLALISAAMHGVNLMLICHVPHYFSCTGKISTVSGVLNACTYIGSAISAYGFAALSTNFGWIVTILFWALIALLGAIFCLLNLKKWNRFCEKYVRLK